MNIIPQFIIKNYFHITLIIWFIMGLVSGTIIREPLIIENMELIFGMNYSISLIFPICYIIIVTPLTILVSVSYPTALHKEIIQTLLICRNTIKEYNLLTEEKNNLLFKYWSNYTKEFQMCIIDGNVNYNALTTEIKNHILKSGLIWDSIRMISSMVAYYFVTLFIVQLKFLTLEDSLRACSKSMQNYLSPVVPGVERLKVF